MTSPRELSHDRRRTRDYPLPRRGARRGELTEQLAPRDIRHAVYGGELMHLSYSLYGPSDRNDDASRLLTMLQALTLGTDRVISHLTAASFHGMTDEVITAPFHLTSPRLASQPE